MSWEPNFGSQVSLIQSLHQFYLTEENLNMFYNLKGLPMKALEARSDTGWFSWILSYITAHIFQISVCYYPWDGVGPKTTFTASSHYGSELSIVAVYTGSCSSDIRCLTGSASTLFIQSWCMKTQVVSCWENLWNFCCLISSVYGRFIVCSN